MGRQLQFDDDEYRLPEGMRRIAYDADSQTYTFRDANGDLYTGAEGARYGELRKIESQSAARSPEPSSPQSSSADSSSPISSEKPARVMTRRFTDFSQLEDCGKGNDSPQGTVAPLVLLRRTLTRRKNTRAERRQSASSQTELLPRSRSGTV